MESDIKAAEMSVSKCIVQVILLCLISFGLYEGVTGILQVVGVLSSGHALYPATGTFFNPGPCCGFIAMLMPLAFYNILCKTNRVVLAISYLYFFVGIFMMPILMGRTGWVAAVVGCAYAYIKVRGFKIRKSYALLVVFAICVCSVALYFLKPESALGRIFLWKLDVMACAANPFCGVGWNNVSGAIGSVQEAYFAGNPNSIFAGVAGCPDYAFNEFLQIAIAYGVGGLALFVMLFVFCFISACKSKEYGLAGSVISAITVCMASYPLQFSEYIVVFCVMLVAAIFMARKPGIVIKTVMSVFAVAVCCCIVAHKTEKQHVLSKWQTQKYAYQYSLSERNLQELDLLHSQLYWSKNFLFDYGKILRNNKQYSKSIEIMHEGEKISSDPMFLNLIGRNYYDLKDYEQAAHYFERSINRLPGRLYPYYLLAKVYADSCNYNAERFSAAFTAAMRLTPKVQSRAIRQMRAELQSLNDSINHVPEIQ
jgi:hypothetical protein